MPSLAPPRAAAIAHAESNASDRPAAPATAPPPPDPTRPTIGQWSSVQYVRPYPDCRIRSRPHRPGIRSPRSRAARLTPSASVSLAAKIRPSAAPPDQTDACACSLADSKSYSQCRDIRVGQRHACRGQPRPQTCKAQFARAQRAVGNLNVAAHKSDATVAFAQQILGRQFPAARLSISTPLNDGCDVSIITVCKPCVSSRLTAGWSTNTDIRISPSSRREMGNVAR